MQTPIIFGHEIISKANLPLPLILAVIGERLCTRYWLTALVYTCTGKVLLGKTDRLDITLVVDWDVKPQIIRSWKILRKYSKFSESTVLQKNTVLKKSHVKLGSFLLP